jgi:hypothetical protein
MKRIKLGIVVIFIGMFFITCAITPERRACYQIPPEQSKLCAWIGDYWEETNVVLRISNAVMIEEGVYSAEQALKVINTLDTALDSPGGATYALFFKLVADKAGPLVAITISESINELVAIPDLITPFDKSLIRGELAKHRLNIELFISIEKG